MYFSRPVEGTIPEIDIIAVVIIYINAIILSNVNYIKNICIIEIILLYLHPKDTLVFIILKVIKL